MIQIDFPHTRPARAAPRGGIGPRLPIPHQPDCTALPADIRQALRKLAGELRDMPRDVIRDRQELVHWLSWQARRIEAVADSRVRATKATVAAPIAGGPPAAAPNDLTHVPAMAGPFDATAVPAVLTRPGTTMAEPGPDPPSSPAGRRVATSRNGWRARVALRQARAYGQIELVL